MTSEDLREAARTDELDLVNCDREPIHIPGAIQPHGVLLCLDGPGGPVLTASESTREHLGVEAVDLVGSRLAHAVGDHAAALLHTAARAAAPREIPLEVPTATGMVRFHAGVHHERDLVLIELEPASGDDRDAILRFGRLYLGAVEAVQGIEAWPGLLDAMTGQIGDLTGHDRVVAYRFAPDGSGEVVAERVRPGMEPWLGQRYPATDIPRQARRLYEQNWLRIVEDFAYTPSPLVPGVHPRTGEPFDLSHCDLRSVSPIHVQYMHNIGSRASVVLTLMSHGRLWGMIAAHNRTPHRVPRHVRLACRALAQLYSMRIEQFGERDESLARSRLSRHATALIEAFALDTGPARFIDPLDMLGAGAAHGALFQIDGRRLSAGVIPPQEIVSSLARRLEAGDADATGALLVEDLARDRPGATGGVAGALLLPVSGVGNWLAWFRREEAVEVVWAGEPQPDAGETLTPRASFTAWRETVRGHCPPWGPAELASARSLADNLGVVLAARAQSRRDVPADVDPVSGLPTRRRALAILDEGMRRGPRRIFAVVFVDLDRFKAANDALGHAAGDAILAEAGERLRGAIRADDIAARSGGDEFLAVLCGVESEAAAIAVASRIVAAFRIPFHVDGRTVRMTASVGVAIGTSGDAPAALLAQADQAMHRAKGAGRDRMRAYRSFDAIPADVRSTVMWELPDVGRRGELLLDFQPIVDPAGAAVAMEALVRWRHPRLGLLPPAMFIETAEEIGVIEEISDWVLSTSLSQLARWTAADPAWSTTAVSVNISGAEVGQRGFAERVVAALETAGADPRRLILEVTEGSLARTPETAAAALERLRATGVRIAIDDFGKGYSSLGQARDVPADIIKIDRAFVPAGSADERDARVLGAIMGLAEGLGLEAVLEGIETPEHRRTARACGVRLLQGFGIARPAPADRFTSPLGF